MPFKILTNPTVEINNVIIAPKAGSVGVVVGKGETAVKGISAGGGFTDIVISEDIESRVGKIKFMLDTVQENYELFRGWASIDVNIGSTITVTQDDFHATMRHGVIIGDPEFKLSPGGEVEIEFHGTPID